MLLTLETVALSWSEMVALYLNHPFNNIVSISHINLKTAIGLTSQVRDRYDGTRSVVIPMHVLFNALSEYNRYGDICMGASMAVNLR